MTRSQIDLAEIARICIEQIRPLAKIRGIQVHCDLQPTEIFGNADRLAQVINNLLSNAIHYNKPNGEVAISTRIENASAILAVADTGLGLAICKSIIEGHGGTIEVTSKPAAGATFAVRLPVSATEHVKK